MMTDVFIFVGFCFYSFCLFSITSALWVGRASRRRVLAREAGRAREVKTVHASRIHRSSLCLRTFNIFDFNTDFTVPSFFLYSLVPALVLPS